MILYYLLIEWKLEIGIRMETLLSRKLFKVGTEYRLSELFAIVQEIEDRVLYLKWITTA